MFEPQQTGMLAFEGHAKLRSNSIRPGARGSDDRTFLEKTFNNRATMTPKKGLPTMG